MSGRVLVTGGAGFIGSHLVDALLATAENVTVLDDFSTGTMENLVDAEATGRLRVVRGSILDPAAVAAAMADCDRAFHLAVQCLRSSLGQPRESHAVNATGTLNLLEAARIKGVRRFVYCSSSEVYGNASDGLLREDDNGLPTGDDVRCRQAGGRTVHGGLSSDLRSRHRHRPSLQRLRPARAGAWHPRGGDPALSDPCAERTAAGHLRRRHQWPRLHLRDRAGARPIAGRRDRDTGRDHGEHRLWPCDHCPRGGGRDPARGGPQ